MTPFSDKSRWKIVPYRSSLLPALRQIFLASRRAAFHWQPADNFKLLDLDDMIEGETILVAMLGEEPVGFVSWWPPGNFIHHLFVAPDRLRQGVGAALLRAALEQIDRPVRLKCICRNQNALEFYFSQGWEIEQKEENENGEYYVMVLNGPPVCESENPG